MKTSVALAPKRAYIPPRLLVYGDLTEMTQAMGQSGSKDGGMGMTQKTGL